MSQRGPRPVVPSSELEKREVRVGLCDQPPAFSPRQPPSPGDREEDNYPKEPKKDKVKSEEPVHTFDNSDGASSLGDKPTLDMTGKAKQKKIDDDRAQRWASLLWRRPPTSDSNGMSSWLLDVLAVSDLDKPLKGERIPPPLRPSNTDTPSTAPGGPLTTGVNSLPDSHKSNPGPGPGLGLGAKGQMLHHKNGFLSGTGRPDWPGAQRADRAAVEQLPSASYPNNGKRVLPSFASLKKYKKRPQQPQNDGSSDREPFPNESARFVRTHPINKKTRVGAG